MRIVIPQRRDQDCGVAALACYLGVRYEDAFVAAVHVAPKWKRAGGLGMKEMCRAAARIGRPLERVHWRRVDLDESVGILGINWNNPKDHNGSWGHWVVLFRGVIADPRDPSIGDASDYLTINNGRAGTLLVEPHRANTRRSETV